MAAKRKLAASKKAPRRPRAASAPRAARAAVTWDALLGHEEALHRAEKIFVAATRGAPPVARAPVAAATQGQLGIWWTDPTFPIFYNIIVNGTPLDPPNYAKGGQVIRTIPLVPGRDNRIAWAIRHTGQGWKNRVLLKLDDAVTELGQDQDESPASTDDLSRGVKKVPVP